MTEGNNYYDSTENPEPPKNDLFAAMDEFAKAVELFTGFKQQFIAAGWSEEMAEQLVLHVMKSAPPGVETKKE